MGLFGSSALKRKITALSEALESAEAKVTSLEGQCNELTSSLSAKDESYRIAKEGRQKAEKKLEKIAAKSMSNEKRLADTTKELERITRELNEYRQEILSAKAQSERLQAKLARQSAAPAPIAAVEAPSKSESPDAPAPAPAPLTPEQQERRNDRKVSRLQEQLDNERAKFDEVKGRALRAEQALREADKRRASDSGKTDARLREAEHALQSERKAYKILQLQYQGLLESTRGQQQTTEEVASAPSNNAPAETEPVKAASEPPSEVTPPEPVETIDESATETAEATSTEAPESAVASSEEKEAAAE